MSKLTLKQTRLILVTFILIIGLVVTGCAGNTNIDEVLKTTSNTTTSELTTQADQSTSAALDEFVGTGIMSAGTYVVGDSIEEGYYDFIYEGDKVGRLRIADDNGDVVTDEVLSPNANEGITQYTIALYVGDTITITGIDHLELAYFEALSNNRILHAGFWGAGIDVEVGQFMLSVSQGSGSIFVYGEDGTVKVNDTINATDKNNLIVDFADNDTIEIRGLDEVILLPAE